MRTLYQSFNKLSINTWNTIHKGKLAGFPIKEETITDINLLYLMLQHPSEITTKVYNKIDEGKNGADWEWWFTDSTEKWIGFRVQAKIINTNNDRFDHMHYPFKKDTISQCDKLIINAELDTSKMRIPIYCFYVQTDNSSVLGSAGSEKKYGCSITHAKNVKKLRPSSNNSLDAIAPDIIPWQNLVYKGASTSEEGLVERIFELFITSRGKRNTKELYILNSPPYYVDTMTEEKYINREENPNLAGVMIIKGE